MTTVEGLTGVSPRTISNASAQPLLLFGTFTPTMTLHVGPPFDLDVPLHLAAQTNTLASALLPATLSLPPEQVEATVEVSLRDHGIAVGAALPLVIINDQGFVDLFGLAVSGSGAALTVSTPTDVLYIVHDTGVQRIAVGDGPSDVKITVINGDEVAVVSHTFEPSLRLVSLSNPSLPHRIIAAPLHAHTLLLDGNTAYVASHHDDSVVAIDLVTGAQRWRTLVGPNPRGMTMVGDRTIAVGSMLAGEVQFISTMDGAASPGIAPQPGVTILGGHTEPYRNAVIGGKGVRALASGWGAVFVASIGPNVGPNDDKMGVSGIGGVGVIDVATKGYVRHLAFNYGVSQALALDDRRGRLYVADVAEGLLHVVDAKALVSNNDRRQRSSWLSSTPLPVPDAWPTFRPREDFGIDPPADEAAEMAAQSTAKTRRRGGVEMHSGPSALSLSADGKTLWVLERFTARITRVDVGGAEPKVTSSVVVDDAMVQRDRRLGQVIYFTDLGRTGMSCDSCHIEGHTEGVFYTKTGMMRLWRSSTLRGVRDTPPYFNPPGHLTLADTAKVVGGRNRFQNPPLLPVEVERLTTFTQAIAHPPNPHRGVDGGLLERIDVGEGRSGRPAVGRRTFLARCASCHPAPLFSTDQDKPTRRQFMKVSTADVLDIRRDQQDLSFQHRTPPSLVGGWDNWPMLLSGAAGFDVKDGNHVVLGDRSALRSVVDEHCDAGHGNVSQLPVEARDDLVAFLMSL
jgi:hypothetical protein